MKRKKYKLNREKFIEFLAGVGCVVIAMGIWMTFLLSL